MAERKMVNVVYTGNPHKFEKFYEIETDSVIVIEKDHPVEVTENLYKRNKSVLKITKAAPKSNELIQAEDDLKKATENFKLAKIKNETDNLPETKLAVEEAEEALRNAKQSVSDIKKRELAAKKKANK